MIERTRPPARGARGWTFRQISAGRSSILRTTTIWNWFGTGRVHRDWPHALEYCTSLGLALPGYSEAVVLGKKYDVPGVGASGFFWTSDGFYDGGVSKAFVVTEAGVRGITEYSMSLETVCTTTPTDAR